METLIFKSVKQCSPPDCIVVLLHWDCKPPRQSSGWLLSVRAVTPIMRREVVSGYCPLPADYREKRCLCRKIQLSTKKPKVVCLVANAASYRCEARRCRGDDTPINPTIQQPAHGNAPEPRRRAGNCL